MTNQPDHEVGMPERGGTRRMVESRRTTGRPAPRLRAVAGSAVRAHGRPTRTPENGSPTAVAVEEPDPRTVVLRVRGTFDEAAGLAVTRVLDDRLDASATTHVVIDLVGVSTLATAGVSTLHRLQRACRTTGTHLVLVGTANPAVHRFLYFSGLLPLVDARPTVEAALRAGRPSPRPVAPAACGFIPNA